MRVLPMFLVAGKVQVQKVFTEGDRKRYETIIINPLPKKHVSFFFKRNPVFV